MNDSERIKEQKRIRNKRTGRTRTIIGWVLLICGLINLTDLPYWFAISLSYGLRESLLPVLCVCLGVWLISSAKKNVAKWNRYEALINQEGNTPIKWLARQTGVPENKVRDDIQEMINNGFFRDEDGNIGAYINGEYDILVMMKNGHPKESVEKTAKEQAKAEAAARREERPEEAYIEIIHAAAEEASDPDVEQSLRSIEASVRKIDTKLKHSPDIEKNDSVRQLREIYLPKTMELIGKLTTGNAGSEAMLEIKGILNTCAVAYKNIVDKVYKSEDEDTIIDIEVLRKTFEREGLLDSDFDFE